MSAGYLYKHYWPVAEGGTVPEEIVSRKLAIDRPCSACSAGDTAMEYHDHRPPFRKLPVPQEAAPRCTYRDKDGSQCIKKAGHAMHGGYAIPEATAPDSAMLLAENIAGSITPAEVMVGDQKMVERVAALIREAGSERERDAPKFKIPSRFGMLDCEMKNAVVCHCGERYIGPNTRQHWYYTIHGVGECTLQLPNLRCWCGLLRSEHIEGHAEASPSLGGE